MKRIVKLGVGPEKPGRVVYEGLHEAEDAAEFAAQLREAWATQTRALAQREGSHEDFLWLTIEVDESGWLDFDLEDEVLEILDAEGEA
jgi:hypothetical protein